MRIGKKSPKKEKKAMSVSLYANLFFVVVELAMAIITSSQAVLLDAVYDGIEFFMLLPSVLLIPLLYKPSNERYPFGYMQIESVFIVVKGITMTAVTVGLIANSVDILLHGGRTVPFDLVAWFELFACLLSVVITIYLYYKNKVLNSPIITSEMQGWVIDCVVSFGMTMAFFLPKIITVVWFAPFIPYLDSLFTIVLSMFMLPAPIKTVATGFRDLMLIAPEEETVQNIKSVVEQVLSGCHYRALNCEIIRTGRKLWISAYITLDKDELSVHRFQILQADCIAALAQQYTDFYFELLPEIQFDKEEIILRINDEAESEDPAEQLPVS